MTRRLLGNKHSDSPLIRNLASILGDGSEVERQTGRALIRTTRPPSYLQQSDRINSQTRSHCISGDREISVEEREGLTLKSRGSRARVGLHELDVALDHLFHQLLQETNTSWSECIGTAASASLFVVTAPRALATMASFRSQSSAKTNTWHNKTPSFIALYQLHCVHIHFDIREPVRGQRNELHKHTGLTVCGSREAENAPNTPPVVLLLNLNGPPIINKHQGLFAVATRSPHGLFVFKTR